MRSGPNVAGEGNGHQAIGLDADAEVAGGVGEEVEVEAAVGIEVEDGLPVVAAVGDVMGFAGEDDTFDVWHQRVSGGRGGESLGRKQGNAVHAPNCSPAPNCQLMPRIARTCRLERVSLLVIAFVVARGFL